MASKYEFDDGPIWDSPASDSGADTDPMALWGDATVRTPWGDNADPSGNRNVSALDAQRQEDQDLLDHPDISNRHTPVVSEPAANGDRLVYEQRREEQDIPDRTNVPTPQRSDEIASVGPLPVRDTEERQRSLHVAPAVRTHELTDRKRPDDRQSRNTASSETEDEDYSAVVLWSKKNDGSVSKRPDVEPRDNVDQLQDVYWKPPLSTDIANTHKAVETALLRTPHAAIDLDTERGLVGGTKKDSGATAFTIEVLKTRQELDRKRTTVEFSHPNGKGTELAELIRDDQEKLGQLLDWSAANPRGIRAQAIQAAESQSFRTQWSTVADKANTAVEAKFGARDSRRRRNALTAAQDTARLEVLDEARKSKDWSEGWFDEQIGQYMNEDTPGLWNSILRQPVEADLQRNTPGEKMLYPFARKQRMVRYNGDNDVGDVQSVNKMRAFHDLHMKMGAGGPTKAVGGATLSPENGRKAIRDHRVYPLDAAYCDQHPGAILSPMTLEREMRLAAVHYKNILENQPKGSNEDATIEQKGDALMVESLDSVLGLMNDNYQRQAYHADGSSYRRGIRPAYMHPDIAKLTALRIAISGRAEIPIGGETAAVKSVIEQIEAFNGQKLNREQAAAYLHSGNLSGLLRGDLRQLTNNQLTEQAQTAGAEMLFLLKSEGQEAALERRQQSIKELGAIIRGRDVPLNELTAANSESIGGLPRAMVVSLGDQGLLDLRGQMITKILDVHGESGSTPHDTDTMINGVRQLTDIIKERELRALMGDGAVEAEEASLAVDAMQRAYEERFPASQRVHFICGKDSNAAAYTGLISVLADGVVRQVTHEGEKIDDDVLDVWTRYSKQQNPSSRPIVFSEKPRTRNIKHGIIIGLGEAPPLGSSAEHVVDQLTEDGVAYIPADGGWSDFGDHLLNLVNSGQHWDHLFAHYVDTWDLTASPPKLSGQTRRAIILTTLKETEDGRLMPNDTYLGLLRRQGMIDENNKLVTSSLDQKVEKALPS